MKRVLKWAGYGLAGVVVLVLFLLGGAFAASEAVIRWPMARPDSTLIASGDSGAVARGHRVAVVNGCHDCHGKDLRGQLFHDDALLKAWGPNLTLLADRSDADLDRAIRHGVGTDGRRLWIMPSSAFSRLTDQETADLIAYVRTFPKGGEKQPRFQPSPMARAGVLLGKFQSEPAMLVADAGKRLDDAGPQYAHGRELARACIECHGPQLKGGGFLGTPDLMIAASYDPADFERLMHTGVAAGDRQVGLMTSTAKSRFSIWSKDEVADLHAYLKARANKVVAEADISTLPKR